MRPYRAQENKLSARSEVFRVGRLDRLWMSS